MQGRVQCVNRGLSSLRRIQQQMVAEDIGRLIGNIPARGAVITNGYPSLLQPKLLYVTSFQSPFQFCGDRIRIHVRPFQSARDVCDDDFAV